MAQLEVKLAVTVYIRNNGEGYDYPYDWYTEHGDESDALFETEAEALADAKRRYA